MHDDFIDDQEAEDSDLASEIIMILIVWNDMQITEYD